MIEERLKTVKRPESKERIQEMFVSVAQRYDLANTLMSFGRHYPWKDYAVKVTGLKTGSKALDICAGTCDLAIAQARIVGKEGKVTAVDFTPDMLAVGEYKVNKAGLSDIVECKIGDAHDLPVGDGEYDAATIATAVRHLDVEKAFSEIYRALKPGGKFAMLEFYQPTNPAFRKIYDLYSYYLMPKLGVLVTRDKTGVYEYLPDSIRLFYSPEEIIGIMEKVGFKNCAFKPLTFGIAGVHSGQK